MNDPIKTNADNAEHFEKDELRYGLYYLVGLDTDGDQVTEINGHESYCYECTDKAIGDCEKKIKKDGNSIDYNCTDDEFKKVVRIVVHEESCPESDDFCYCENCGTLIYTSVLHTFSQEIDHWLDTDTSTKIDELNTQDCYILNKLLNTAGGDYPDLIDALKTKIINQNKP